MGLSKKMMWIIIGCAAVVVIVVVVVLCVVLIPKGGSATCEVKEGKLSCEGGSIDSTSLEGISKNTTSFDLSDIKADIQPDAFDDFIGLKEFIIEVKDSDNKTSHCNGKYCAINGALTTNDKKTLIRVPPAMENKVIVDNEAKSQGTKTNELPDFGDYSFVAVSKFDAIKSHALYGLRKARFIILDKNVKTIEKGAFGTTNDSILIQVNEDLDDTTEMLSVGGAACLNINSKQVFEPEPYEDSGVSFESKKTRDLRKGNEDKDMWYNVQVESENEEEGAKYEPFITEPVRNNIKKAYGLGVQYLVGLDGGSTERTERDGIVTWWLKYETDDDFISYCIPVIEPPTDAADANLVYDKVKTYNSKDISIIMSKDDKIFPLVPIYVKEGGNEGDIEIHTPMEGKVSSASKYLQSSCGGPVCFLGFKEEGRYLFTVNKDDAKVEYYVRVDDKKGASKPLTAGIYPMEYLPNGDVVVVFTGVATKESDNLENQPFTYKAGDADEVSVTTKNGDDNMSCAKYPIKMTLADKEQWIDTPVVCTYKIPEDNAPAVVEFSTKVGENEATATAITNLESSMIITPSAVSSLGVDQVYSFAVWGPKPLAEDKTIIIQATLSEEAGEDSSAEVTAVYKYGGSAVDLCDTVEIKLGNQENAVVGVLGCCTLLPTTVCAVTLDNQYLWNGDKVEVTLTGSLGDANGEEPVEKDKVEGIVLTYVEHVDYAPKIAAEKGDYVEVPKPEDDDNAEEAHAEYKFTVSNVNVYEETEESKSVGSSVVLTVKRDTDENDKELSVDLDVDDKSSDKEDELQLTCSGITGFGTVECILKDFKAPPTGESPEADLKSTVKIVVTNSQEAFGKKVGPSDPKILTETKEGIEITRKAKKAEENPDENQDDPTVDPEG